LFGEDEAREGVGHGHRAEREKQLRSVTGGGRPAICGSDGKHEMLSTLVPAISEPGCKGLRAHLSAAAIEKDGYGRCSALELLNPR